MHLMLVQRQRKHPQSEETAADHDQQEQDENQYETTHSADLPLEALAALAQYQPDRSRAAKRG
jgi:hypothetical protein